MLPILFGAGETSFNTFGIGVLSGAISCEVEENRNGAYELEMTYPVTGAYYNDIQLRCLILAKPNYTDVPQPFRVYQISKPINGVITINAQHISYDLSGYIDAPFTATDIRAALTQMLNQATIYPTTCPFTFTTDINSLVPMTLKHPESVRALMGGVEGSLIDTYGGEWHFNRYNCELEAARGANRGVSIRYGKNLTDLKQEENNASVYTAVYPYYYESDSDTLVTLPEKIIQGSGTYSYTRIFLLDLTPEFVELPTVADLRAKAQSYVNSHNIGVPSVNLTIRFQETEIDNVNLCDTVSVYFETLGVSASAKCIRTKWDTLNDRYIEAELGSARNSLAATIADTTEFQEAIKKYSSAFSFVADKVASRVTGHRGGFVAFHDTDNDGEPDEFLILDNADINHAVNVVRMNNAGIAFSKTGYNGTYTTAWNINGEFVANFIASGELQTDRVKIFGDNQFYWDNDNITLIDPNDTDKMIRFGKYDGVHYGLGFSVDGGTTWTSGFSFDGIKIIGDANNIGRVEMDGDSFDIIDDTGLSIAHLGASKVIDENGNEVDGVYNRLGTFQRYNDSWLHGKYSFSAGRMNVSRGPYSIALGYQCFAIGIASAAIGRSAKAYNDYAYAMGYGAEATGDNAIAFGNTAKTHAKNSVAIGNLADAGDQFNYGGCIALGLQANATGMFSVAVGYHTVANSSYSVAIGTFLVAHGDDSVAIGNHTQTNGTDAIAIGNYANATASGAVAIGKSAYAESQNQFVCGAFNTRTGASSNLIFLLGNGSGDNNRSNAMTVDSSGNEVIAGALTQYSDGRYKKIIGDVPDLSGVRAVLFRWTENKQNRDDREHIGYIAQDVEKVAPYLVQENENGIKTLDYIALLCAKVERLENTVDLMEQRIKQLEQQLKGG